MIFCNLLEIKAQTKKVVGVKVISFGVLCVKFRRLKMGDPVDSLRIKTWQLTLMEIYNFNEN